MMRSVASLLVVVLGVGCAGSQRKKNGIAIGGIAIGAGLIVMASTSGDSCDDEREPPASGPDICIDTPSEGQVLGALVMALGAVVLIASAASDTAEDTSPVDPYAPPPPPPLATTQPPSPPPSPPPSRPSLLMPTH